MAARTTYSRLVVPAPRRPVRPLGWVVVVLIAVLLALTGCAPPPSGPESAVLGFVEAIGAGDINAAADLTDRPDRAAPTIASVRDGLQAKDLTVEIRAVGISGDSATVDYTYTWTVAGGRQWSYGGRLPLARRDGQWLIRWSPSDLHPSLGTDQTLDLRLGEASRGRVVDSGGGDVLVPGRVLRVEWSADGVADTVAAAEELVDLLSPAITPSAQAIVEMATGSGKPVEVAQLDQATFDAKRDRLERIAGVSVTGLDGLVAVDPTFAPEVIDRVRSTVVDRIDGTAGWRVVQKTTDGALVSVLTETPPEPGPSLTVTLDRAVQVAAQNAVDTQNAVDATDRQAMIVVLQPSTGAILAVAQSPVGPNAVGQSSGTDRDGPAALTDRYLPGSTFTMITAGAAIDTGLAGPDTTVPCPRGLRIGERTVSNRDGVSLGTVSMETAFARSCTTTFAYLASRLPADGLTRAAAQFGIGPSYDILGLPNVGGSVPPTSVMGQRAEDGAGQGAVLVSTFDMALAAATVANGSTPVPHLLVDADTTVTGDQPAIEPAVADGLRRMMRAVIVGGAAGGISDRGDVYGRTGEAEVPGGAHARFVGYRGDLAFATLVVHGGASDNAVAVTRAMFDALPTDYGT